MTQSKKNKIIIGTLVAVVLLMVVGYAAFSTSLNVSSTSNITTNWDIKITNISVQEKSSGATDTETPTYDNTNGLSATFNTSFAKPGDYETYKIEITNSGDFNAKLSNIIEPTSSNPDISFYVNKDESNTDIAGALAQNGVLNKSGETGNVGYVYVTVFYRSYDNQQTPSDANRTITATIKFNFEQTDQSATVTPELSPFTGVVYRYGTDELSSGDSIEGIITTTDYQTLGKNFFLKHNVTNNLIDSSEVCFIKNGLHCLISGDDGNATHDTNLALLWSVFDKSACGSTSGGNYCDDESFTVNTSIFRASVRDNIGDCYVSYGVGGVAACREW